MSIFKHTLVAEGVIGNKGFQDFTTKNGKDSAKVDVACHPGKKDDPAVWYTVFCTLQNKKFMTETCGYGPGDTVMIIGETSSFKTVQDGQYQKMMQDTVLWGEVFPMHKKFQKPSEIAGQQAQAPQQYQQVPQQQYQQPPQPPQPDMGYEAAKAAAAQADMQVPAQAPPQVPPQAPVQQPQQQAPAPQQMQMAPPQPNGQAADDETLPI